MTNAELAILSLIVETPRHGYEIEQVIEHRGMRNWTDLGFSSIYYLLKKLEGKGLISSQLSEGTHKGPARKVFSPTLEGKNAWQEASLECLRGQQDHQTTPFLMGLAAVPALNQKAVNSALNDKLAGLQEAKEIMLQDWEAQKPLPPFVEAMFTYSLALIEAEENWLQEMLTKENINES